MASAVQTEASEQQKVLSGIGADRTRGQRALDDDDASSRCAEGAAVDRWRAADASFDYGGANDAPRCAQGEKDAPGIAGHAPIHRRRSEDAPIYRWRSEDAPFGRERVPRRR